MNRKSLFRIGVAAATITGVFGCSLHRESSISTTNSGESVTETELNSSPGESQQTPLNCEADAIKCRDEYSPVHCTILGQDFLEQGTSASERHVWGSNECLARQQIVAEICKDKVNIVKVESILCTPDPAEGSCPPERTFCTREFDPTTCRLVKYDNKDIGELQLMATGSNRCEARGALGLVACKNNFNPNKMTEVDCTKSKP